jgi:outer membrane protein TolC
MSRAGLPLAPCCRPLRRCAFLCAAGALLLSAGCQVTLPMKRLLLNGPSVPGPLSSGLTPPLRLTAPHGDEDGQTAGDPRAHPSGVIRTAYQSKVEDLSTGQALPAPDPVPSALPAPAIVSLGGGVNLDLVLRLTFERNADILTARERVHESQIALDAALRSCKPEMLRTDTFKKPVADATVWRRRVDLRKTENDNLQDAANTYFDWLTAVDGEAVARDLLAYEEKLLNRARKLAQTEKPVQVVVESIETAFNGRQQYIFQIHQQSQATAAKLTYLMGMNGGALTTAESLQRIDRVDTSAPVAVLVQQAQSNGPGVSELQGLIASIQHGIDQARGAQCLCAHTGAPLICARLQMGQSQVRQAQLALESLQLKLRAGVEDAFTAVVSGHEQIDLAVKTIDHAKESYRIMDLRLTEEGPEANMRNRTFEGVLNSIRQLSQTYSNYLTALSNYNKAQARVLIMLGTYDRVHGPAH